MSMNSVISISHESVMTDYHISDDLRDLIVQYMTACNEQRYADSEVLLQKIKLQGKHDEIDSNTTGDSSTST